MTIAVPQGATAGSAECAASPAISIRGLTKVFPGGRTALGGIDLDIEQGEIFALLGPNGAGKTTLISIACGLVNATSGSVTAGGYDIVRDYRAARRAIGLVPQELTTDAFETVLGTVTFSRGLFGRPADPGFIEKVLRDLSLWDRRSNRIVTLSGGMKRRLMIAKALSHEPRILFLDEPSAGVDVELRRDMWDLVRRLRAGGVTIILTTHYIEEAEEMADRVGVINHGRLVVVEQKAELMRQLGRAQLVIRLEHPAPHAPQAVAPGSLELSADGMELIYSYDLRAADNGIQTLLRRLDALSLQIRSLETRQSSLEDIFVKLVHG